VNLPLAAVDVLVEFPVCRNGNPCELHGTNTAFGNRVHLKAADNTAGADRPEFWQGNLQRGDLAPDRQVQNVFGQLDGHASKTDVLYRKRFELELFIPESGLDRIAHGR